ncbi:MAG: ECF transporter S component [Firmicutes bacterium]|nr:ECF transporter S component [Bacillota bacterium]
MSLNEQTKSNKQIYNLCIAALFLGLNIAASSVGIPVPGGHFYLNDVVICTAALLLNPLYATLVGGVGAFLGDVFFYPAPMFVSLVVRGLQALAISLIVNKMNKRKRTSGIIGVAVGAVIMVVGYTLGRAYVYSTPEYAILKLPFQIAMAVIGGAAAIILVYVLKLGKIKDKYF